MADARIRGRIATASVEFSRSGLRSLCPKPTKRGQIMGEAAKCMGDDELLIAAGDLPDDAVLEEDKAIATYANRSQARQPLRKRKLGRGSQTAAPEEAALFPTGNASREARGTSPTESMDEG
eukprot:421056-Pyramimonas_sp.AAC.1